MNDKPIHKAHAWAWALCLMAVPVLYILSTPWVVVCGYKFHINQSAAIRCYLAPIKALPDGPFWRYFYNPYFHWCWTIGHSYGTTTGKADNEGAY